MEKVFQINIGNYTFTIEEPAYLALRAYLDSLQMHFNNTEGKEEIIGDIEVRIGELLQQKLSDYKKVINLQDIEEVLAKMGKPSDFGEGDATAAAPGNSDTYTYKRRRIFRDPENKRIGGVCGGIGAYFDVDPMWLRLAFVLLVIFAGTGILLYIILWMVLPEARTVSEKLEMRGEPVDVQNIEKTIKENMNRMKKDFKNYYKNEGKENMRKGAAAATGFAADLFQQVGYIFIRIIGGILLFFGLILLVIWSKTMVFPNAQGFSHFLSDIFSEGWQKNLAIVSVYLIIALPLLGLCVGGFQMLFGIKARNRAVKYSVSFVSSIAIIAIIYLGYATIENFSTEGSVSRIESVSTDTSNVLNIYFEKDDIFSDDQHLTPTSNSLFYFNNNEYRSGFVKLYIRKSLRDSSYTETKVFARGLDATEARTFARHASLNKQQSQGTLNIPNYIRYPKGDVWRNQHCDIYIYVKPGTILKWQDIPDNVETDIEFANEEEQDAFYHNSRRTWMMGENGLSVH